MNEEKMRKSFSIMGRQIKALEEENQRLREALTPFAEIGRSEVRSYMGGADWLAEVGIDLNHRLKVADLYNAKEAMS